MLELLGGSPVVSRGMSIPLELASPLRSRTGPSGVDGFEDGDISEYSGDRRGFEVQQSVVANGARALEGRVRNGVNRTIYRNVGFSRPSRVQGYAMVENGGGNEDTQIVYHSGGTTGTAPIRIDLNMNYGNDGFGDTSGEQKLLVNGTVVLDDIDYDRWYLVELERIDWHGETVGAVRVDGRLRAEDIDFDGAASSIDTLALRVNDWGDQPGWFDDVSVGPRESTPTPPSSGDGGVRITDFETPTGTVEPGDRVRSSATVENTGSVRQTIFVGYSVIAPDGRPFDNNGTTGKTVTISPGEQVTVELTWTAVSNTPSGHYDTVTALWEETDRDALETELDREETVDAFELVAGTFPAGTSILPPTTPQEYPYTHTQTLRFRKTDREGSGIEGKGVRLFVDREFVSTGQRRVTVRVENPEGNLLDVLYGHGSSQLLVLYEDDAVSLATDEVLSQVDGGEPRALSIVSALSSVASLGSASSIGELVKEAVEELAMAIAEEGATSQLIFETPPDFEGRRDVTVATIDFSTETVPLATSPRTIQEYELQLPFTLEPNADPSTVTIVADMRGMTFPLPNSNPITGSFSIPVEYRKQVDVPIGGGSVTPVDRETREEAGGDGGGTSTNVPGFGIGSTLAALGGLGYLLKDRSAGEADGES